MKVKYFVTLLFITGVLFTLFSVRMNNEIQILNSQSTTEEMNQIWALELTPFYSKAAPDDEICPLSEGVFYSPEGLKTTQSITLYLGLAGILSAALGAGFSYSKKKRIA